MSASLHPQRHAHAYSLLPNYSEYAMEDECALCVQVRKRS